VGRPQDAAHALGQDNGATEETFIVASHRLDCGGKRATARRLAVIIAAALLAVTIVPVRGEEVYPARPIKLVVPFAAGGSNDVIGRALAESMRQKLSQPVIIENKGGGGSTLGTDLVAKAPPDGYTLLFVSSSLTTNAAIKKSLPYDPVKDLEPVAFVGASPLVVIVGNKFPAKTFGEFVDYARTHPKEVNYGSAGVGGINHLGTEMLASAAHIELTHVPYKGMGLALTDLMGGQIQMVLPGLPPVLSHIRAGTVRGLAVTSLQRSALAPELPTVAESGIPGLQLEVWFGVLGPAGMPKSIVAKLNQAINEILRTPAMRDALAKEGVDPRPETPQQFGDYVKAEITRWSKVIKDANIPLE
jgi:tripartite-type tricarboxylate transporter receptor subunit TctC